MRSAINDFRRRRCNWACRNQLDLFQVGHGLQRDVRRLRVRRLRGRAVGRVDAAGCADRLPAVAGLDKVAPVATVLAHTALVPRGELALRRAKAGATPSPLVTTTGPPPRLALHPPTAHRLAAGAHPWPQPQPVPRRRHMAARLPRLHRTVLPESPSANIAVSSVRNNLTT